VGLQARAHITVRQCQYRTNTPAILPDHKCVWECAIDLGTWPVQPIFDLLRKIGRFLSMTGAARSTWGSAMIFVVSPRSSPSRQDLDS